VPAVHGPSEAQRSYETFIAPFVRPFAEATVRWSKPSALAPNALVLDHGAGTGLVTKLLHRERDDIHVVGLDPNHGLLSSLAGEQNCCQILGTATDLLAAEDRFDLAVSNAAISFCPDPSKDLEIICSRMKPGGRLVVTSLGRAGEVTPFHRYWSAIQEVVSGAWEPDRYPHHSLGDPQRLRGCAVDAGWSVEHCRAVHGVRRISCERAWTWLNAVLPVGVGESYRPLTAAEHDATREVFVNRWAGETRWRSTAYTLCATT
jgi:SAM-dependent methyltransferase